MELAVAMDHLNFDVNIHLFDISNITTGFSYHYNYPPAPMAMYKKHLFTSTTLPWPASLLWFETSNAMKPSSFVKFKHATRFFIVDLRIKKEDFFVRKNLKKETHVNQSESGFTHWTIDDLHIALNWMKLKVTNKSVFQEFIKHCKPKEKVPNPLNLSSDFKTDVQGQKCNSTTGAIEPPL